MDAIETLKQQAREKRDQAIAEARAEFRESMAAIRKLERGLAPAERKPPRASGAPVFNLVVASIPAGDFAAGDLLAALRAADPKREFNVGTVRIYLRQLNDKGLIRRVARGGRNRTLWTRVEGREPEANPFAAWFIPDAVEAVLRESGPLRIAELVVALQDRGYRVDADPMVLANSVGKALGYHPERFAAQPSKRWGLSAEK